MSGDRDYSFESCVNLPTDITFVINEEGRRKSIEAHKYFLAKSSPVFRALIYSTWRDGDKDEVEIKKTSYEAFKKVISFIYNPKFPIYEGDEEEITEIVKIADWYHLPTLKVTLGTLKGNLRQIPTDVEFVFGEEETKETVKAHKYLLAQKSPVFKAMLFGPLQENRIQIKGTSLKLFKLLIDFMYEEAINVSGLDLCQQFEIYNLGEMYDVAGLKLLASEAMSKREITKDNVIEMVSDAERYSQVFKEVSEDLIKRCVRFVAKEVLHSRKDFITFSSTYLNGPHAATAMKLMASLPDCTNCLESPCLTGSLMKMKDITKGTRVSSYNDSIVGEVAYVMSKDDIGVHGDDGKMYKFCFDLPPRDIDMLMNPTYHHQLYLASNGRLLGGSGVARGGIYWHCTSAPCLRTRPRATRDDNYEIWPMV